MTHVKRYVKCPRHHFVRPGKSAFKMVNNPYMKNISQANIDYINKQLGLQIRKQMCVRDRFGNKVLNFDNHMQPELSAAFVIEHIYDPEHPICKFQCKGRCLRGMGKINTKAIDRLKPA